MSDKATVVKTLDAEFTDCGTLCLVAEHSINENLTATVSIDLSVAQILQKDITSEEGCRVKFKRLELGSFDPNIYDDFSNDIAYTNNQVVAVARLSGRSLFIDIVVDNKKLIIETDLERFE